MTHPTEPDGTSRAELEVRKSRFIGTARKVSNPDEAKSGIRGERESHPGARHVAFAFLIGDPRSEVSGMSDDGEPKGTAGRPVLEVLKGSGVRNVLVTVTRYFGGVKLGTGGLVKAYTECAQAALEALPVKPLVTEILFSIDLPYECFDGAKRLFKDSGVVVIEENFTDRVWLKGRVAEASLESLRAGLKDLTRGAGDILLLP